jgi:hypothetical protein
LIDVDGEGDAPSDAVMRSWLRAGLSGCLFVPRLSAAGCTAIRFRSLPGPTDEQTPVLVDAAMREATEDGKAIVLTFPFLKSAYDVATLLRTLASDRHWTCVERPGSDASILNVDATWQVNGDKFSRVMGLAPLGTMPLTRRAPYVALCAWAGGHQNPWRQPVPDKPRNAILFSDMPHGLDEATYKDLYEKSERRTQEMMAQVSERPPGYKLTFSLERAVYGVLFADN